MAASPTERPCTAPERPLRDTRHELLRLMLRQQAIRSFLEGNDEENRRMAMDALHEDGHTLFRLVERIGEEERCLVGMA